MDVRLAKKSNVIGLATPRWAILHNNKFICGGDTQKAALDRYIGNRVLGTIQNLIRLGRYRKAAKALIS